MYHPETIMQEFEKYRWYLLELNSKEAEKRRINAEISQGIASMDTLNPAWEQSISEEIDALRHKLKQITDFVSMLPETARYLPCKLFIRLHYIIGYSILETASEMNVSLSTIRRIRDRCEAFYSRNG